MRLLPSYDRRHPRFVARLRFAVGVWLLVLTSILIGFGRWWGVILLVPAGLPFYLSYRIRRYRLRGDVS
jgi:hypothetical protein